MSDNWLTVSQAALQLGISERQARRYAARLSPEDREEAPDVGPDTILTKDEQGAKTRPARRPARVRLEAMQRARDEATKRENPPKLADTGPDARGEEAGQGTGLEPDTIREAPDATSQPTPVGSPGTELEFAL